MKYFKKYMEADAEATEVTKEDAKRILYGWWKDDFLARLFNENRAFHLYTPFTEVWTMTDDGVVPEYGFVE